MGLGGSEGDLFSLKDGSQMRGVHVDTYLYTCLFPSSSFFSLRWTLTLV